MKSAANESYPSKKFRSQLGRSDVAATSTKVAAMSLRPPSRPKLLQRRRRCDVPPRRRHQVARRCRCDIAGATQSSVKVANATSQRCRKFSQKVATAMLPRRSTSYNNCTCGKALSNACKDVLHHTHQIMQSNLVKGPMID